MVRSAGYGLIICSLLIALLGGCSGKSADGVQTATGEKETTTAAKQVTLTFWKAPNVANEGEIWAPIFKKFEDENPNIKIEYLETPWDGWDQKYTAAYAGSSPPDVAYMPGYFLQYAKAGQLTDLSGYFTEEARSKYSQSVIDYVTVDGKPMGKPLLAITSFVLYNKDLFAAENVDIPQTWDELVVAAQKLTKGPDQWGIGSLQRTPLHVFVSFVGGAGGNFYKDNKDTAQFGFDTPEGLRGLQFVADLYHKYKVIPPVDTYSSGEQETAAFTDGKIAMMYASANLVPMIRKEAPNLNLGAFRVPAGPAGNPAQSRASYTGLGMLTIAEKSKHKEEAWKFIEFVTSSENAGMFLEEGYFFSPMSEANDGMYEGDEVMAVAKETVKDLQLWPANEEFNRAFDIAQLMLEAILRGVQTPEEAVRDAVKEFSVK